MIKVLEADRIVGLTHVTQLAWLGEKASKAQMVLEVGSYRGRSTKVLCDNCPGTVTAVDTWRGSPGLEDELGFLMEISGDPDWLYHEFLHNMQGTPNLEIIRGSSGYAAGLMTRSGRKFDMIFLDGLHDYQSVRDDISAWWPLVSDSGMMCGHDFDFPDVAKAIRSCFPEFPEGNHGSIWAVYKGKKP